MLVLFVVVGCVVHVEVCTCKMETHSSRGKYAVVVVAVVIVVSVPVPVKVLVKRGNNWHSETGEDWATGDGAARVWSAAPLLIRSIEVLIIGIVSIRLRWIISVRKLLRHGGQQPTVSVLELTKSVAKAVEFLFFGVAEFFALLQEIGVGAGAVDAVSAEAIAVVGGGR